jgi:hypothetical protein
MHAYIIAGGCCHAQDCAAVHVDWVEYCQMRDKCDRGDKFGPQTGPHPSCAPLLQPCIQLTLHMHQFADEASVGT